jgi:hypothetical protein
VEQGPEKSGNVPSVPGFCSTQAKVLSALDLGLIFSCRLSVSQSKPS